MRLQLSLIISAIFVAGAATAQDAAPFIAGTAPSQRPDAAVITQVDHGPEWFEQALTGVSEPYPESLHWLDDQGEWFNPFIHPGMTGPYDIRGWHKAD